MKNIRFAFLLAVLASLFVPFPSLAQGEQLRLSLLRNFGYGGFNNDIQGLFTMKVSGPENLVRMEFYIDDTKIGEATTAPFRLQFSTDSYPLGQHKLYAIGFTSAGQELRSQEIIANFVAASEGMKSVGRIIVPILVVVLVAILLASIVPILTGRRTISLAPGSLRQYPLGGAICPRCGRPFAMHIYGMNLLTSKLDRCPYCGKWSVVRHQSLEALRAAEQAELEGEKDQVPEETEEEKLKRELDDSKLCSFLPKFTSS
jgi:DNA-directed RNA polymerase subunit RPC12/RpoP